MKLKMVLAVAASVLIWLSIGAEARERKTPRTCMFELPEEVAARDALVAAIGGEFNERNAAAGAVDAKPVDVSAEIAARRTALDKAEALARTLPDSKAKVAYFCAIEMQRRQIAAAADEQTSGKLRKQFDGIRRARDAAAPPTSGR